MLFSLNIFFSYLLFSLTIGSFNIVSLQPNITFVPNDPNGANKAQGFAWLKNGFTLQDQTTTCSLNLILPVSGSIALNGGTLYLQSDTVLDNNASINSMGSIVGASYSLALGSGVTSLPFSAYDDVFNTLNFSFNNDLSLTGTVTIQGNCTIDGNGNQLSFGTNGKIKIDSGSSLKLKNVIISNLQTSNIQCVDSTATVTMNSSTLILANDFVFDHGSLVVQDKVTVVGPYVFNFRSSMPLQLLSQSTLTFSPTSTFFYNPSSSQSLIQFTDSSSTLAFNNSTFHANTIGTLLTKGNLHIIGKVNFTSDGTTAGAGIIFGNNSSSSQNINVLVFPASTINITSGYVVNQNL